MKYAVIETGGKQYKVQEGDSVTVERLSTTQNLQEVIFSRVLLLVDEQSVFIGTPFIENAIVKGALQENIRGEKLRVLKFKAKARYRRAKGHRQSLSKVIIQRIITDKSNTSIEKITPASSSKRARNPKKTSVLPHVRNMISRQSLPH